MKKAASLLVALSFICSGAQGGQKSKISADASATDVLSTMQVIVQWTVPIGTVTSAKITNLNGRVINEFKSVHQGVYSIPASALAVLDADPDVKFVSVDRKVKRKLATTAAAINAPQVWQAGFIGTGVGVAIVDSGVNKDDNLGLSDKAIVFSQDFTPSAYVNGKPSKSYGLDWYGHGQHIAGIVASSGKASSCGNCSKTMIGIAPGASLIDLKVLDSQGEGTDSQVIAAIDQAISLQKTYNIRVMNLSLGRPVYESYTQDPLCQAVEAAWQAGIVVVVAAGNDGRDNSTNNLGYGTVLAPGNDPYVITVGSMKTMNTPGRSDDLVASYSSRGPTGVDHIAKPDLVAPGNLIVSLLAQHSTLPLANPQNAVTNASIQGGGSPDKPPTGGNPSANNDPNQEPPTVNFGGGYSNKYYTLSGTSMAAAVVSGAVADIIHAYPKLTPDQIKILLMQTASKTFPYSSTVVDDLGNTFVDYYDMFTIGAGYLDLQAAIKGAPAVPASGNSLSPATVYDSASGNVYVTFDTNSAWVNQSVWSDKARWGASAIWSSSVLSSNQALWSSKARWGASADDASKSLWGARSKWGASSDQSAADLDSASSIQVTGEN